MQRLWLKSATVAGLIALNCLTPGYSTAGVVSYSFQPKVVRQLENKAQLIQSLVPSTDSSDLTGFGTAVGAARIVGLGEASHGSREVFTLKQRAFRYLVEHKGFSVLAVEGDWSNWLAINAYIQGGPGTADEVLRHQEFSIYRTREMLDLIGWMRAYNAQVAPSQRLSVAGVDFQEPSNTYRIVQTYVNSYLPRFSRALRNNAVCYGATPANGGPSVSTARRISCGSDLNLIEASIVSQRPLARRAISARADALAAAHVLMQSEPVMTHEVDPLAARDAVLAANATYIAERIYPNAKMAIWAHDGHVSEAFRRNTMGMWLRRRYGRDYFAIGTVVGSGQIRAKPKAGMNVVPMEIGIPVDSRNSTASLFSKIGKPFFLDVRAVPDTSAFGKWLSSPQTLWLLGGVVDPGDVESSGLATLNLRASFDALFFVPVTQATQSMAE